MDEKHTKKITEDLVEILHDKGYLADNVSLKALDLLKTFLSDRISKEIDLEIARRNFVKIARDFTAREKSNNAN